MPWSAVRVETGHLPAGRSWILIMSSLILLVNKLLAAWMEYIIIA